MEPENDPRRPQPPNEGPSQISPAVTPNPLNTAFSPAQVPNQPDERSRAQILKSEIVALVDDLRAQPREPGTRAVIPLDFFDRVDAVFARYRDVEQVPEGCDETLAGIFDFADLHPEMDAELDAMPPLSTDFASRIVSAIRQRQSNGPAKDG